MEDWPFWSWQWHLRTFLLMFVLVGALFAIAHIPYWDEIRKERQRKKFDEIMRKEREQWEREHRK